MPVHDIFISRSSLKIKFLPLYIWLSGFLVIYVRELNGPLMQGSGLPHGPVGIGFFQLWQLGLVISLPFIPLSLFGLYFLRRCRLERSYYKLLTGILVSWVAGLFWALAIFWNGFVGPTGLQLTIAIWYPIPCFIITVIGVLVSWVALSIFDLARTQSGGARAEQNLRVTVKTLLISVAACMLLMLVIGKTLLIWWNWYGNRPIKWDPLMAAAADGNLSTIQKLVAQGRDVNFRDDERATPLMYAASFGYLDAARFLIQHGADVNARGKWGVSALDSAINQNHSDIVDMLIDYGASVNSRENDGETPLMRASSDGHADMVRLLLDHGAYVNARDNQGETALMHAAFSAGYMRGGYEDVLLSLIHHGAGINMEDNAGLTALEYIEYVRNPNPKLIALLRGSAVRKKPR